MIRKPNWVIMGQDGGISIIMERALERRLVGTLFIRPKEFAGPVPIKKLDFRASIFFRFSFSSLLIQHKTQSFIFTLAFVFLFGVSMAGLGGEIGGEREIFDHLPSGLSRFVFGRLPLGPGEILRSIHHQPASA